MYQSLTVAHNLLRWFVIASLLLAIYRSYQGYFRNKPFEKFDNVIRHWTATIAHLQLIVGIVLYFKSPITQFFLKNSKSAVNTFDLTFFGIIHPLLMLISILVLTLGSAVTKRRQSDREKFQTMLLWYSIALLIMFIAIPWPFSPFVQRPYYR